MKNLIKKQHPKVVLLILFDNYMHSLKKLFKRSFIKLGWRREERIRKAIKVFALFSPTKKREGNCLDLICR